MGLQDAFPVDHYLITTIRGQRIQSQWKFQGELVKFGPIAFAVAYKFDDVFHTKHRLCCVD